MRCTGRDSRRPHVMSGSAPASQPVRLGHIQPPGKKLMNAADWARGARLDRRRARHERPGKPHRRSRAGARQNARTAASRSTRPAAPRSTCYGRSPNATPTPTSRCPHCCASAESPGATRRSRPNSTYGTCRTRGLLDAVISAAAGRAARADRPGAAGSAAARQPINCCAPASNAHAAVSTTVEQAGIEFDSARAGFVNGVLRTISRARRAVLGAGAGAGPRRPTRSATPRSCTPIHAGSPRRSPTRWARTPVSWTPLLASDDERPAGAPGSAPRRADRRRSWPRQCDGTVGRYSPYAVYLPAGDPGGARGRCATARRWCRTRAASWWPGR